MDYRSYLALAIPFIISMVTQPILGAVDTGVIGRLDDALYIGGVAIGKVVFNTLYWFFGFLRVSTSGFSSQSLGNGKQEDKYHAYLRPASLAILIVLFFIIFQNEIWTVVLYIALVLYTAVYIMALPHLGNHGLWLNFIVFSLCRSVVLYLYRNNLFENVVIRKRKGGMLGASTS